MSKFSQRRLAAYQKGYEHGLSDGDEWFFAHNDMRRAFNAGVRDGIKDRAEARKKSLTSRLLGAAWRRLIGGE